MYASRRESGRERAPRSAALQSPPVQRREPVQARPAPICAQSLSRPASSRARPCRASQRRLVRHLSHLPCGAQHAVSRRRLAVTRRRQAEAATRSSSCRGSLPAAGAWCASSGSTDAARSTPGWLVDRPVYAITSSSAPPSRAGLAS